MQAADYSTGGRWRRCWRDPSYRRSLDSWPTVGVHISARAVIGVLGVQDAYSGHGRARSGTRGTGYHLGLPCCRMPDSDMGVGV